ncbi:uncharacterized protein DUF4232 [Curtobacterium sp. PhB130]|uniref:DUF4232 domain-containing protein n=1 Tax=Curtobacterium sp. PhB130 TaxID=2485178 RepID=UPI000FA55AEF|nr:DUF4232 domain-containing protein [Curtobacterium sp. PhB130]ROS77860.1 uncharacterized protein DUF4232 [Curtobacterium sp. PhB130]
MIVSAGVALLVAGALAGCSSGGDATPTATATRTVTASPSTTPAADAPSASATAPATSGSASGSGSGSGSATPTRCAAADLAGSLEAGSGGAAGSTYVHLALRNTGSATCTLQGWPGVSFVGGGTGTQIGAAATEDQSGPHPTVTLAAGQTAVAQLRIVSAAAFDTATCQPQTPDGFRVYPPGSKQSLFVEDAGSTACKNPDAALLSVQALVPEGQATS